MTKFYLAVVLLFIAITGAAQSFPVKKFTVEDGLPSNTIYCIYKDSKGYLWISTDKGLTQYNGLQFRTFTTSDGLPDNEIFNIREDLQGRIWLSNFKGAPSFWKNGVFHTAANTPWLKLSIPNPNFIGRVSVQQDGSILNPSADGSTFLEIKNNTIKVFSLEGLKKKLKINSRPAFLRKVNKNQFQVFYPNWSALIDSNANLVRIIPYNEGSLYGSGGTARESFLFSKSGMRNLNDELVAPYDKVPYDSSTHAAFINRHNEYFITTNYGLLYNNDQLLLKGNKLTFIEGDIADNIWVGTKNGVYKISKHLGQIKIYPNAYQGNALLARSVANTLFFINGRGDYFKLKGDHISLLFHSPIPENNLISITKGNFFISDKADYFFTLRDLNWLSTGVLENKNTIKKIPFPKSSIAHTTIKEVLKSGDNLFISTISALKRISYTDLTKGLVQETVLINTENDNDLRIFARAIDPLDSSVWLSRADGIFKIIKNIPVLQSQFKGLVFRQFAFYGQYLIGFTASNELFICHGYNGKKMSFDNVRQVDCIWENIYKIDNQRVFISTNNYYRLLTLYQPDRSGKPKYTMQTIEDPFIPKQTEYIVTDSNNAYFFKEGTITQIATKVLFERTPSPITVFLAFKTQDKTHLMKSEIKISYAESKTINILFDNLSFIGKDITSQYSISEDGEDDWQEITGNEINLNRPGYGTFTIKVRSKTLSSGYSKPAVLVLNIQKPFWATWWFISICTLIFIVGVWGIIIFITWRRLRKKQKEHDADMKYQQSEYKALNALMNPHFIFNSLNNIQGLINKDEKRIANQYLVIFSDLVRQNMHNISKGFISLQEELTLIENYLTLEKLRFKELVNYRIKIEEDIDIDDIMIPPLMIQPLVENAVKHGLLPQQSALSIVIINVYEKEDTLYVVIEDNGIGLTESLKRQNRLHDSFGLSNLQKRTEHLKKIQQHEISIEIIEVKDERGAVLGTRATVTIQLN